MISCYIDFIRCKFTLNIQYCPIQSLDFSPIFSLVCFDVRIFFVFFDKIGPEPSGWIWLLQKFLRMDAQSKVHQYSFFPYFLCIRCFILKLASMLGLLGQDPILRLMACNILFLPPFSLSSKPLSSIRGKFCK